MIHLHVLPFLPYPLLGGLMVLALGLMAGALWTGRGAWAWRGLGVALFAAALANPVLDFEQHMPIRDVVALVLDQSGSQTLNERPAQLAAAAKALTAQFAALPDLDTRVIA